MTTKHDQEEFIEILTYGIHKGNETQTTVQELIKELSGKLKDLLEKSGE